MPYPSLLHSEPLPLWPSTADPFLDRRCSNTVLSQPLWCLWALVYTRLVWAPEPLWQEWGLILNMNSPLLCLAGVYPLPLDMGYLLKEVPVLHSHCSSTYCLPVASLTLLGHSVIEIVSPFPLQKLSWPSKIFRVGLVNKYIDQSEKKFYPTKNPNIWCINVAFLLMSQ